MVDIGTGIQREHAEFIFRSTSNVNMKTNRLRLKQSILIERQILFYSILCKLYFSLTFWVKGSPVPGATVANYHNSCVFYIRLDCITINAKLNHKLTGAEGVRILNFHKIDKY